MDVAATRTNTETEDRVRRRSMASNERCGFSSRMSRNASLRATSPSTRSPSIAIPGSIAMRVSRWTRDAFARSRRPTAIRIDGRVFIDATYEGDLMAAAGVPLCRRT